VIESIVYALAGTALIIWSSVDIQDFIERVLDKHVGGGLLNKFKHSTNQVGVWQK
jgi:hypothetical protein